MATLTNNPNALNNQEWTKKAITYTEPKKMEDLEREFHLLVRGLFREFIEGTSAESISKATAEQLESGVTQTATFVKNGSLGEGLKLSISQKVVVACWSLRAELNRLAQENIITCARAIEKYVIDDFDFEKNATTKKPKAEPKAKADAAPKTGPVATLPEGAIEREDLLPQLQFHGADSPTQVAELLEAWNMGGNFRLMVRRSMLTGKVVKSLNEQDDRQTLCLFDEAGKRIGMAYMDKLAQYFTVVEFN